MYLLVAVVECNPLHPLARCRDESDEEDDDVACVDCKVSMSFFRSDLPEILCAAKSFNRSFGTLIRSNLGTRLIKKHRTQGAILCVLGFR